jgi:putative FmdB family regulatory protein
MPTYDYACAACGHRFEEFQSMSADPLKKCPACRKNKLERLIGAGAGVIFKGSGFYQTDYKNSGSSGDGAEGKSGGGCTP